MKKVVVGSENPVKVACAREAFARMFPHETFEVVGCKAASEVQDQPWGDEETLLGAKNRAHNAKTLIGDGDYYVGLEGGVELQGTELWSFAWMYIEDTTGKVGKGRTAACQLPLAIARRVQEGEELGVANDAVFHIENSKQKNGIVGSLTNNVVVRKDFYLMAMLFALIPFVQSELY